MGITFLEHHISCRCAENVWLLKFQISTCPKCLTVAKMKIQLWRSKQQECFVSFGVSNVCNREKMKINSVGLLFFVSFRLSPHDELFGAKDRLVRKIVLRLESDMQGILGVSR